MKIRPFELALIIIFGGLGLLAVLILSIWQPPASSTPEEERIIRGSVEIWGTVPAEAMNSVLSSLAERDEEYAQVSYRYLEPSRFDSELTVALADDVGPDLIFVTHERLANQRKRIQPISYESYPLRDISNLYLDGAQIFALSDGLYALPIMVDPLMMYWNRDVLANEGLLQPPSTWEEMINIHVPRLTDREFDRTVNRSAVAMGTYGNERNAFGTLSALILQGGSRAVREQSGDYLIQINESGSETGRPLVTAIDFYTRFSRPSDLLYTWNRSFEEDRLQFIGEDLIYYYGYGSEGPVIERLNPNLNFDIAELPQGASATVRRTYGKFYGLSALKSSDNLGSAFAVMSGLGSTENVLRISSASNMVPARRELVVSGSNGTYSRYTFQSAPITYGWLNPNPATTNDIFATMISDVNENRQNASGAAGDAIVRLRDTYK